MKAAWRVEVGTPRAGRVCTTAQGAGGAKHLQLHKTLLVLSGVLEMLTGTPLVGGIEPLFRSPPGC